MEPRYIQLGRDMAALVIIVMILLGATLSK